MHSKVKKPREKLVLFLLVFTCPAERTKSQIKEMYYFNWPQRVFVFTAQMSASL